MYVEKHPDSTLRHTRNRAGKTSLIEIIHWLLGANLSDGSEDEQFRTHQFGMCIDLGDEKVTVERGPYSENGAPVTLKGLSTQAANKLGLSSPTLFAEYTVNAKTWTDILGRVWFGIGDYEGVPHSPSFRTLINYFVRRERTGGFSKPELIFSKQRAVSYQVNLTFLLGLDWTIPQEWESVRENESQIKQLRKAISDGKLSEAIGSTTELRTLLAVAENKLDKLVQRIRTFRVHESYNELEEEAASLAVQLRDLSNANQIDRETINEMIRSIEEEGSTVHANLAQVYSEVGITLPGQALRHFEVVKEFHEAVINNRRLYIQGQIKDAEQRIREREMRMRQLDERNSQIASVLNSHGALEQMTILQTERGRLEGEISNLRERFKAAQSIEGTKSRLEIDRQQLHLRLMQDYDEQSDLLNRAIVIYEEVSSQLYEDAGSFGIEQTTNGPEFYFTIHGSKSKGIKTMQIFCFDMMLARLTCERGLSPGFLIHDSNLFDGVDTRQVRGALKVGAKLAEEYGFQYIVTLNSDQLYEDDEERNEFDRYIVQPRLDDMDETGGLFGYRFG